MAKGTGTADSDSSDLVFDTGNDPSFWFKISRKSTGDVLFDTSGTSLVFENQFLELKTALPTGYHLSGLGERLHGLALGPGFTAASWATDNATPDNVNLYGSHPVYIEARYSDGQDAAHHGVYFRNAHGQEALLGDDNLSWRWIGGSVDLYFFDGPSAQDVASQYQSVIGFPAMQQYWTLGYQQCAWGYDDWDEISTSMSKYSDAGIPLEVQWADIDYMDGYRDFTMGGSFTTDGRDAVFKTLKDSHMHFIPIVDVGIKYEPDDDNYPTYTDGAAKNLYVTNIDGSPFIGDVWPGASTYVDWTHPDSWQFWADNLKKFHDDVLQFDGIWIDMSEASNHCNSSCHSDNNGGPEPPALQPGERDINNPPYKLDLSRGPIWVGVISMNATHSDGSVEYEMHNLYGYQTLNATYNGITQVIDGKRPFTMGRSTFAGSGKWAAHWGGDNYASWDSMKTAIPDGITMALYGISMFGTDTCGFWGDTTEELCGRWALLNAFFPFYRNHYADGSLKHEYWQWDSVTQYAKDVIKTRYSLLPYLYNLMWEANNKGHTFLRAVSWEFPQDSSLFDLNTQFMVGPSLMVIPVLDEGATSVDGYLPGDQPWYDWQTHAAQNQTSDKITFDAPQGHIPLFIRGGSIIPTQEPGMTIYESRQGKFNVTVALGSDGTASGDFYLDDGESQNPSQQQTVTMAASDKSLKVIVNGSYDFSDFGLDAPPPLDSVIILGVDADDAPQAAFNGNNIDSSWDGDNKVLTVSGLADLTKDGAWTNEWTLSW